MSALPHPIGKYRAYKKIGNREYQLYFPTLEMAKEKQQELNAIASLKPKTSFRQDGSMVGVSISLRTFPDRERSAYISARLQINGQRREIAYKGSFEPFWTDVRKTWASFRNFSSADLASMHQDIRAAKRFYIARVGELEALMRDAT